MNITKFIVNGQEATIAESAMDVEVQERLLPQLASQDNGKVAAVDSVQGVPTVVFKSGIEAFGVVITVTPGSEPGEYIADVPYETAFAAIQLGKMAYMVFNHVYAPCCIDDGRIEAQFIETIQTEDTVLDSLNVSYHNDGTIIVNRVKLIGVPDCTEADEGMFLSVIMAGSGPFARNIPIWKYPDEVPDMYISCQYNGNNTTFTPPEMSVGDILNKVSNGHTVFRVSFVGSNRLVFLPIYEVSGTASNNPEIHAACGSYTIDYTSDSGWEVSFSGSK